MGMPLLQLHRASRSPLGPVATDLALGGTPETMCRREGPGLERGVREVPFHSDRLFPPLQLHWLPSTLGPDSGQLRKET